MERPLIWLIRLYQIMPFSCHTMCRFTPSCSEYMIEALNEYGLIKGLKLGVKRIIRCHPRGNYGYDPVPVKGEKE